MLSGTAYTDINIDSVTTQKIIPNDEKTNIGVDFIIDTMNSIFQTVYNLQNNLKLEQLGNQIIQDSAKMTEEQVNSQLVITKSISETEQNP